MILHVIFAVAGAEYAIPVDAVLQMETFVGATQVPGSPPYVAGIVTVRGVVVPVIDLRARFGLPPGEMTLDTRIVVTRFENRTVALRVDKAREVLKLDTSQHQPAPSILNERSAGFVYAIHSLGPRVILLVDLSKILGETSHDPEPRALPADAGSKQPAALPG